MDHARVACYRKAGLCLTLAIVWVSQTVYAPAAGNLIPFAEMIWLNWVW